VAAGCADPERVIATLSDQLLHAQEDERQRLAIELHESISQPLAGLVLGLISLRKRVGGNAGAHALIDELGQLTQEAVRETRVFSHLMIASHREEEGLAASVDRLVDGFGRRAGLKGEFEAEGPVDRVSAATQHAIFRVVQEALLNVHRHARAKQVWVKLTVQAGVLRACVRDDGHGANVTAAGEFPLGVGVAGMKARVEQLGGRLTIARAGIRGTAVIATVPLASIAAPAVRRDRLGLRCETSGEAQARIRACRRAISESMALLQGDAV
jgi:signal transduction histidine kinase